MEEIERYIQYAVDNGFNLSIDNKFKIQSQYLNDNDWIVLHTFIGEFIRTWKWDNTVFISLEKILSSSKFIEAIARGMKKEWREIETKLQDYSRGYDYLDADIDDIEFIEEFITINQAIAIREEKLEEFISKLLTK